MLFFFFKQKTAYEMRISDWSSDVCSSDLRQGMMVAVVSAARDIVGVLWLGGAPNLRLSTARVPCRACGSDARQRLSTMQRSLHLEIGRASCRERVCQYV